MGYLSPEQAEGRSQDIGPATDIWALGVILYQMLTGRTPFVAESLLDSVRQTVQDEAVSPAWLRPGLSRDLEAVCLKCLGKKPTQRYASAELLADDLRRFLDGKRVSVAEPSLWSRARRVLLGN
jgi:serine/threonine protein kinase